MRTKHYIARARRSRLFGLDDLLVGVIGGSIIDAVSGHSANQAMIEQANANRDFSRNAHQIEVADLKAAGLSPLLSYRGQGASLGGGVMPDIKPVTSNTAQKITSAMEANAQIDVLKTQATKNTQEGNLAAANTALADKEYERKVMENEQLRRSITEKSVEVGVRKERLAGSASAAAAARDLQAVEESKQRVTQSKAEVLEIGSRIDLNKVEADLKEAQRIGANLDNMVKSANVDAIIAKAGSDALIAEYEATERALGAQAAQAAWRVWLAEKGLTMADLEHIAALVPNMSFLIAPQFNRLQVKP